MTLPTERPAPRRRVTIVDVARAAGVSVATVSKVVNRRYGVAASTGERVMAVVEELGYETSLVASSLRRHETMVLGVLVAGFEPYSAELLKGISAATVDTGYELLAYAGSLTTDIHTGWERRSLSRLAGTLIDGAIIVTPTTRIPTASIPVIAIDPHSGPGTVPTVDSDNLGGARLAVQHLIDLGHTRIAHVRGRAGLRSADLREEGYREALAEAGIAFDAALVREGAYWAPTTTGAARDLLARPDRPTAVFAANDLSAVRVLEVARDLGLRVPEDLSVVGFDNVPESTRTSPQLTTIAQPLQDMGARAVTMLIDTLHDKPVPDHVSLPAHLIERQSTAAPPA